MVQRKEEISLPERSHHRRQDRFTEHKDERRERD